MTTITAAVDVISESRIVVFCPHFDDFLFTIGGWVLRLKELNLLGTRKFHIVVLFSRSNYTAHAGAAIYDTGLARIKYATGQRVIEDMECLDELIGPQGYEYSLAGFRECFARGKVIRADSKMEYPYGTFETFDKGDWAQYQAIQSIIAAHACSPDTAIVLPLAIREHVDHFITREAGLKVAKDMGPAARASFYFQEDKPYSGHSDAAEWARTQQFIQDNQLQEIIYETKSKEVVDLAFRHYTSQVDETYREGVLGRANGLMQQLGWHAPLDRMFKLQ